MQFPFLFGGTFIEGLHRVSLPPPARPFPFLFGGTFIEGFSGACGACGASDFPSFSEGLSLRDSTSRVIATVP